MRAEGYKVALYMKLDFLVIVDDWILFFLPSLDLIFIKEEVI